MMDDRGRCVTCMQHWDTEARLIAAEQALATEVANCAQALVDMNQARLRAEQALREIASNAPATYAWCKQRAKEALE